MPSIILANISTILYLPYLYSFFDIIMVGFGFFIITTVLLKEFWEIVTVYIYSKIPVIDIDFLHLYELRAVMPDVENGMLNVIYNHEIFDYGKRNIHGFDTLVSIVRSRKENVSALEYNGRIVSYYIMATISKDSTEAILSGKNTINDLPDKGFCPEVDAGALYICNVGIVEKPASRMPDQKLQAVTLALFWASLFNLLQKHPAIRVVICRPTTNEGDDLAKKLGFSPVARSGEYPLYVLSTDHLPCSFAAIQKCNSSSKPLVAILPQHQRRSPEM